jgi:hypothetical protein
MLQRFGLLVILLVISSKFKAIEAEAKTPSLERKERGQLKVYGLGNVVTEWHLTSIYAFSSY